MAAITSYLPWIAFIVAITAYFARDGVLQKPEPGQAKHNLVGFAIVLVLTIAAMAAGWKFSDSFGGAFTALAGFAVGVFVAAFSYTIGNLRTQVLAGKTAPMAFAAAGAAFAFWFGDKGELAYVFGIAVAAWILSLGKPDDTNPWAMRAAVFAAAIASCNLLAERGGTTPDEQNVGTWIALTGVIAGIMGGAVGSAAARLKSTATRTWISTIVGSLLWLGGAFLIDRKAGFPTSALTCFGGSLLIALFVAWLVLDDFSTTLRTLIAGIIWITVATIAFGLERGIGMAFALLAGVGSLLVTGNRKALLSLGPLGAIVIYRVFRESHTQVGQAFDIGQHYALIGVMLGILLPVIAQEWLRFVGRRTGTAFFGAGALWVLLLAVAPVPIAVALSDKGIIGYLIGLGFAPIVESLRGERSAHSLSLALGLGSAMTLLYDWLVPHLDLDRHGKLMALGWIVGVAAITIALIAFLSKNRAAGAAEVAA